MTERINRKEFKKWLKIVDDNNKTGYVSFIDGDPIEKSDNFPVILLNTLELAEMRKGATVDIFNINKEVEVLHSSQ